MSRKSANRFNVPFYGRHGLDTGLLQHIYDYIDGSGPVNQSIRDALLNDALASSAWQRNEESAEAASQRQIEATHELRQTQFQDTVAGAQAAGINPIFALGAGMTSPAASPQASSPSGSTSSGAPRVTLDSLLNIIQTSLMAKKNRAEVAQLRAETNVANVTARNIAANTAKTQSETTGQELSNEWQRRTLDARTESENLRNSLTRAQVRETYKQIDVAETTISKQIQEAKTEESKRSLMLAQEMLANADAENIAAMRPYFQLELSARAAQERAQAEQAAVAAAYQNGLINAGMIEAVVRETNSNASVNEIETELKRFSDALNHGDTTVIFGVDTASGRVMSGLYQGLRGLRSALSSR